MPILGPVSLKTHARKGHAYPDAPELRPIFEEMGRHLMLQKERNPGFFPALLSTLRNFPLSDMEVRRPACMQACVCAPVPSHLTCLSLPLCLLFQWAYHAVAAKLRPGSTLVVWGDKDEVTPFGHSQTVMRILGPDKARLVVLTDCGHVDALEVPRSIDEMMGPVVQHLS